MSFRRLTRISLFGLLTLAILYLVLLIPASEPPPPGPGNKAPFVWNQDSLWNRLEIAFDRARTTGCDALSPAIRTKMATIDSLLDIIEAKNLPADNAIYSRLEEAVFQAGPLVAACHSYMPAYLANYIRMRRVVKRQSRSWNMDNAASRDRLYRLLYGGRAALEEIMLQMPGDSLRPLVLCTDEPSQTPSAEILGVTIHSGDILVSRGGAPTSALIARGNDYPGNFSHVALVHVDENTHKVSIIESHIEIGVAVADIDTYIADTKLRVMVLRLRSDLPQLVADPMLPHKAAAMALQDAEKRHTAYDFDMDFTDHDKLFCSEVASAAYEAVGINLWMGISHISSAGTRSWLGAFGVKQFETQEPSDLEYDPQLAVVAEWRDPETLWKDHIDNAVIDAMLEAADEGERLRYDWYKLPLARLAKGYSMALNRFGEAGPIPEGMSVEAALRNTHFSALHAEIKDGVMKRADEFRKKRGFAPPYWALVAMARAERLKIMQ